MLDEDLHLMRQTASTPPPRPGEKIFIGHGRALIWHELKDFVETRLGLAVDEFNRKPTAGLYTGERLNAMLDNARFALLVMTAEDEQPDGKVRARENVVHEAGLFQGRLGFKRAIILLEDGCETFTNIAGLTFIGFPKGKIMATFEEIRRTLEREGILASS
jgi:predicted nucleotide-binding protein